MSDPYFYIGGTGFAKRGRHSYMSTVGVTRASLLDSSSISMDYVDLDLQEYKLWLKGKTDADPDTDFCWDAYTQLLTNSNLRSKDTP